MTPPDGTTFCAYEIHEPRDMPIRPAPTEREWMDRFDRRFPYRCLPLVMANQAGWIIPSPTRFTVRWNGGPRKQDLRLWFPKGSRENRIVSHFGGGVLTITIPYLFRTPQGINLWVKGPTNWIKDAIHPLEGIVETDWSVASFTMNWKMTRPGVSVRFQDGEPICMIVPVPRELAERLKPCREPLDNDQELAAAYRAWSRSRDAFNRALARMDDEAIRRGWQKDYVLGRDLQGNRFEHHQTRLHLGEFTRRSPTPLRTPDTSDLGEHGQRL